jgi:predicted short-subunit dehydrogenase-like oxidoreductase (DUF2520 family)
VSTVRFIGPGRAGSSLAAALEAAGWQLAQTLGRGDDLSRAAEGTDVLILSVPDDAVAEVARAVTPVESTVVVHLSGSLTLDVLAPHERRAGLHPLVPLPTPDLGATRLTSGVTFAVAGDPMAWHLANDLHGNVIEVRDEDRGAYHAAACIAANHVVALLGQVERVAADAGLPLDAFLGLTKAALDDVERLGPRQALTGPAARGDWETLARHRDALAPEERPAYNAGVALAMRLAGDFGPVGNAASVLEVTEVDEDPAAPVEPIHTPRPVGV